MAKVELNPDWWKKNAPQSIAKGTVAAALAEVLKKQDTAKTGDHKGYVQALDKLKAAASKDEALAKTAKDNAALALLAELKKTADAHEDKSEGHFKFKGDIVAKGLGGKNGVAVPELKGKA
jgi:hypothetical protein